MDEVGGRVGNKVWDPWESVELPLENALHTHWNKVRTFSTQRCECDFLDAVCRRKEGAQTMTGACAAPMSLCLNETTSLH